MMLLMTLFQIVLIGLFFDNENGDVDDLTQQIYNVMNSFMEKLCPQIEITSKYEPVPWMSNEIKEMMAKRKIFYDSWVLNRKHQPAYMVHITNWMRKLNVLFATQKGIHLSKAMKGQII